MPACYVVFNREAGDWQADVGGVIECFDTEVDALRWAFERLQHVTGREWNRAQAEMGGLADRIDGALTEWEGFQSEVGSADPDVRRSAWKAMSSAIGAMRTEREQAVGGDGWPVSLIRQHERMLAVVRAFCDAERAFSAHPRARDGRPRTVPPAVNALSERLDAARRALYEV